VSEILRSAIVYAHRYWLFKNGWTGFEHNRNAEWAYHYETMRAFS